MAGLTLESKVEELVRTDHRYAAEAYHFVFEALDLATQLPGNRFQDSRHIGVSQLLEGLRVLALQQFGPLARCVLESWGIYRTEDFGEVVFSLIEHDLLNQGDGDQKEDFRDGYSFREALDEAYHPTLQLDD